MSLWGKNKDRSDIDSARLEAYRKAFQQIIEKIDAEPWGGCQAVLDEVAQLAEAALAL